MLENSGDAHGGLLPSGQWYKGYYRFAHPVLNKICLAYPRVFESNTVYFNKKKNVHMLFNTIEFQGTPRHEFEIVGQCNKPYCIRK